MVLSLFELCSYTIDIVIFFSSLMTTTYKVVVSNVPPETSREDLEPLLKDTVAAIDVSVNGENQMVTLTYTNKEDAEK